MDSPTTTRLVRYLTELECALFEGKGAYVCQILGVIFEAAFKQILRHQGQKVQDRETLGKLFGKCKELKLLDDAEERSISQLVQKLRNLADHDNDWTLIEQDLVYEAASFARCFLEGHDLITHQQVFACMEQGRRRAGRPRDFSAPLKLDRQQQILEVEDVAGDGHRIVALLVHGEILQGHEFFAERARLDLGIRSDPITVRWPEDNGAHVECRMGELVEKVNKAIGANKSAVSVKRPDILGQAIQDLHRRLQRLTELRPVMIQHFLKVPQAGDPRLLRMYLDQVWSLDFDPLHPVILLFAAVRARKHGLFSISKGAMEARRQARVTISLAHELDKAAEKEEAGRRRPASAVISEMGPVLPEDIIRYIRRECRHEVLDVNKKAEQVHLQSEGGRYELVCKQLEELLNEQKR